MDPREGQPKMITLLLLSGWLLFVIFYFAAAMAYPGGYDGHPDFHGFSWMHNYWCNLLNKNAINGTFNEGRKFAHAAMIIVCATTTLLMVFLPPLFYTDKKTVRVLQICGIASMLLLPLLMILPQHDLIINVSGGFMLIALCGALIGMYRKKLWTVLYLGLFCVVLILVNNLIYYTGWQMYFLPVVQKLTFLFVIIWLTQLSLVMSRPLKSL